MNDPTRAASAPTVAIPLREGHAPSTDGGTSTALSEAPDVLAANARRLSGIAIAYAITYFLAISTAVAAALLRGERIDDTAALVIAGVFILGALLIGILVRRRHLDSGQLERAATWLLILGAVGIYASAWGWESNAHRYMVGMAGTLGIPVERVLEDFARPIAEGGFSVVIFEGVSWVGVWVICFALFIPTSPIRVFLSGVAAVIAGSGIFLVSILVNDASPLIEPYVMPYLGALVVPSLICVIMATFGARVVYGLQRDLVRARRMGSYVLRERIGHGGMGEVWRAEHRMLARPAAIKLVRADALGPDPVEARLALERFEREARATAGLTSPHTIDVYDFGITDEGAFYYVMELLSGFDLHTLVTRFGPVPASRVIHLLAQACHSLHEAHRNGLVHRDIKPANLFVGRRGLDADFVTVLDFGLVKETGPAPDPGLTRAGTAAGTPAFMSPEAISGHPVDARTDLYALGCVAFWLLTGELVFDAGTPLATMAEHARVAPDAPSGRTELPIPASLDAVVLACLSKDPDRRPPSAWALREALLACVPDTGAWTPPEAHTWWNRHTEHPPLDPSPSVV